MLQNSSILQPPCSTVSRTVIVTIAVHDRGMPGSTVHGQVQVIVFWGIVNDGHFHFVYSLSKLFAKCYAYIKKSPCFTGCLINLRLRTDTTSWDRFKFCWCSR